MIKAVVFDLDDTLISEKEYIRSGFKVVSNKIATDKNLNEDSVFNKALELFEVSSKEVFNRLLDEFQIEYSKDYILEFIKCYREHKPNIEFFEDVIPTINKLKQNGYKLGIITDGYKETQLAKIEALNCRELFDEIIITDELGREFWKPHEKSYKMMAEKLDVGLNEMIYVGDNVNKDFITANELGIITVYIDRRDGIYQNINVASMYLAKYKIKNICEIFKIIDYKLRYKDEKSIICNNG